MLKILNLKNNILPCFYIFYIFLYAFVRINYEKVLGKEMIPVSKVTHAVRDAIDEQCIRKFGRQTAIQAITDLRQHEINRKKVLHKLSYINAETYKKGHAGYKAPAWQKKRPWLPVNAPPLK